MTHELLNASFLMVDYGSPSIVTAVGIDTVIASALSGLVEGIPTSDQAVM